MWASRGLLLLIFAGLLGWRYRITRPDYRLAVGEDAIHAEDWDAAEALADRLEVSGHPDHAHFLRGELLVAHRFPGPALAEFNQIVGDGPIRLRASIASGRCLLDLGDLKEAHRAFAYVVDRRPDNVDAHRGLAAAAYDLGQLGLAVEHLERVAALAPDDPRPLRLIGLIHKDMAQYAWAETAYRDSLSRQPPTALAEEIRIELAEVLVNEAKFSEGLEVLSASPAPIGPVSTAVRAECLRGAGRPKEAAELLERALADTPSTQLFRIRGQLYLDEGENRLAARNLQSAVDMTPADYRSHYLLAQAFAGLGMKVEAASETARVEELRKDLDRITLLTREAMDRPWDPAVRLRLAELSDRLGRPELASMWRSASAACAGQIRK